MTPTTLLLISVAVLEVILLAILQKKIDDVNKQAIKADIELFKLITEIGQVLDMLNIRIKDLEKDKKE